MSKRTRAVWMSCALALLAGDVGSMAGPPQAPAQPVKVTVSVAPDAVPAGGQARVTVRLEPVSGVKINRYPRVRLEVAGGDGLVAGAEASVGSDAPPPPDKLLSNANYFREVDPLALTLDVDRSATSGEHRIEGKLSYYYCVGSSFCAPKQEPVSIPLTVR